MERFMFWLLALTASVGLVALACDDDDDDDNDDAAGDADGDADGDGDSDADTGPKCRTYATEVALASPMLTGSSTGAFDEDALTFTSTSSFNLVSDGTSFNQTVVETYGSVADFVREAATVGLVLMTSKVTTGNFGAGTDTYTYDQDGRLTSRVSEQEKATVTWTYTEWDEKGRPTAGVMNVAGGDCPDTPLVVEYDDTVRKMTETIKRSESTEPSCSNEQDRISWSVYDEDGNEIEMFMGDGNPETDALQITVNDTDEICLP